MWPLQLTSVARSKRDRFRDWNRKKVRVSESESESEREKEK